MEDTSESQFDGDVSATQAIAIVAETDQQKPQTIAAGQRGIQLTSLDEMWRFAGIVMASGVAPKDWNRSMCFIALDMGASVGLHKMAAVQGIAVINNRPSLYGDAALGLVQGSGKLKSKREWFTGEGDGLTAHCELVRYGNEPSVRSFSVADAKKASLWGKPGPWTQYERRMLQMRARSWALRDEFADVLKGLSIYEEAQDIPIVERSRPASATVRLLPAPGDAGGHVGPGETLASAVEDAPPTVMEKKIRKSVSRTAAPAKGTEPDVEDDPNVVTDYEAHLAELKNDGGDLNAFVNEIKGLKRMSSATKTRLIQEATGGLF